MNYLRLIKVGLGISTLLAVAHFFNETRSYSLEEMSGFLAVCGTIIQTGFSSYKPGVWDYFIVLVSAVVVIYTLWYCVKYLIKPVEARDHIKFKIVENEKEC